MTSPLVVGRLADALESHTLEAMTNRSVLRTGETVHECNGGCATDIERRLSAVGVSLTLGRAMGDSDDEAGVEPCPEDETSAHAHNGGRSRTRPRKLHAHKSTRSKSRQRTSGSATA